MNQVACFGRDLGLPPAGRLGLDAQPVVLLEAQRPDGHHIVVLLPQFVLSGRDLTHYLDQVAPHGSPEPGSIIRAYILPDLSVPSILTKEHIGGPAGLGEVYTDFVATTRNAWLGALKEEGPGLQPVLGWVDGGDRRFLTNAEIHQLLSEAGVEASGFVDLYSGRGLALLADPHAALGWPDYLSLGPPTKARRMTGREFPIWAALPAHQPALLASRLLRKAEQLVAAGVAR